MPKINAQAIDMLWVHLTMAGVNMATLKAQIRTASQAQGRTAHCEPSVNLKADASEALFKVPATAAWVQTLPAGIRNNVVTSYTEATLSQAFALVKSASWEPS
jgi:hypothetical protein